MAREIALYKKYADKKPIGVGALGFDFGLGVYDYEYGVSDHVITAWINGNGAWNFRRNKIMCTCPKDPEVETRMYIRKGNKRYYLDEFMRTDI